MKHLVEPTHRRSLLLVALALTVGLTLAGCSGSGQTAIESGKETGSAVARIAGKPLTLHEFEDRYARSVGGRPMAIADSLAEYEDFLNRYAEFRMKVMYAEELGLASDPSITNEIDAYRKQLARPFLLERSIMEPILHTLYERRQKIVDASHILIRVPQDAPPADTLAAYNKLMAIRDSARQGVDFGDLAARNSEDPSARGNAAGARGRLGYFSGGQMVESFEEVAYTTPVDSISGIFRSQFGYHILKVHDLRDRVPDRWASHIAVRDAPRLGDNSTPRERIEAIYAELKAGADFREMAKTRSEDTETGSRGGQLGRVAYTTPQLPESFKNALFNIPEPGGFSDIIETAYGLHIVRLDQIEEPQTFEESYEDLKLNATRLPRVREAEDRMAATIRKREGVFVDTTAILSALHGRPFRARDILDTPAEDMSKLVIGVGSERQTFKDIVDYAETANLPYIADTLQRVYRTIDMYLNNAALDLEASRLEVTNDDFKTIMAEFRDGLLLFKLMEDSVWSAAAQDTAALMAYHHPRADSFWFPDRTRIISIRSRSDSTLKAMTGHLSHGLSVSALVDMAQKDTLNIIRVDTTFMAGPNNSVYDRALSIARGQATAPILNAGSFIALVNDGVEPARQKTFWEARAEVLSEYQEQLEDGLVKRLRKKYKVQLYPAQLAPAFAEEKHKAAIANIDPTLPQIAND